MTVTSPSSGMTARRHRGAAARTRPRSRARAALVLVLAAVFTVAGVAGGAGPVLAASTPDPSPTPTPTGPSGIVGFTLSPVGDGIVGAGDQLAVSLTVTNDTVLSLPPGSLQLELGDAAITDRALLERWLGGATAGVRTTAIAQATAGSVDPTSSVTEGVTVAGDSPVLRGRSPGVYPLLARYERSGTELVSTSAMIVPRTTGPLTPVGVVVPITAGALTTGVLDADALTALTEPGGSLSEQLDAVSGTTAILAVDPAIPASIRILGSAAPLSATDWLERLLMLPNPRFALQYGDADVATQLAAGAAAPLQPTTLQPYMTATDFPVATPSPSPAPDSTAPPAEPDFPDLDTLLDIGGVHASVFWPVAGTADTATAEKLAGFGDDGSLTLIPSATTKTATAAVPARGAVGKSKAAVLSYDSAVSAALREASLTDENVLRGRPLTAATALLALAAQTAGDTPLLITVDRAGERSRVALGSAIRVADAMPATRSASLAELEGATPHTVTIDGPVPDPERVAEASALFGDEDELTSFASILTDPTQITGRERASILQLLGAAWVAQPADWTQAVGDHRERTTTTLNAVSILPPTPVNLATSGASLQYWVRNDLPYPVDLLLYATPDDLRLDVRRVTKIEEATPLSNTRVGVPVQARLGNAEVTVELQLRSPTGVSIGGPQFAAVNVRADWEGIGVGIVLALIAAFVGLGLVRMILRRRTAKKTDAAAPDVEQETP